MQLRLVFCCWLSIVTLWAATTDVLGQNLTPQSNLPHGRFLKDTAQVGQPVQYSLSFKHDKNIQVVFPDSSHDFAPFEFVRKAFFTTRSDSLQSMDSAVYTVTTFELDSLQNLSLPIYVLLPSGDSLAEWTDEDTLIIRNSVKIQENLIADTIFWQIKTEFNYIYWGIGATFLLILLLLANSFLGKPLNRAFKLLIMYQRHKAFHGSFDKLTNQILKNPSALGLEKAQTIWKKYIEKVDNIPYSTYTTREINQHLPDTKLKETLQAIDRYVYGGIQPNNIDEHLQRLLKQANAIYELKRSEIRKS
ncbi:hypothetical protein [Flexibacter flexilis]|nr:hypothetical protein [Flexibacter flexilis]